MSNSLPTDDAAELTTYIETRFHERHRAQLPLLVQMAEKVETVHGEDAAVPSGLADILRRLIGEMAVNMNKNEIADIASGPIFEK